MRVVVVGTKRWTGSPIVAVALSEGSGDHPDLGGVVGVMVTREAAGRGREEAGHGKLSLAWDMCEVLAGWCRGASRCGVQARRAGCGPGFRVRTL